MNETTDAGYLAKKVLLQPSLLIFLGLAGAGISLFFSFRLLNVNENPVSLLTIVESGCDKLGASYEVDAQFLSERFLSIIVMYETNPYDADAADGCRLRAFETIKKAEAKEAKIVAYSDIPEDLKEDVHLSCGSNSIGGDSIESTNYPSYLTLGEKHQPYISFCIESSNFNRSFGVREYKIQLTRRNFGMREPDTIVNPKWGYRVVGSEWYSILPAERGHAYFRITDEAATAKKQVWLFVLAALFGASVSAVFEAILAFGHHAILERLSNQIRRENDVHEEN
jgi:hypothetical protein